jgi:hypothetical protein
MKRQSVAEQALAKQVKNLNERIDTARLARNEIEQEISTLTSIRTQLEAEIETLKQARLTASNLRKP